MSAVVVDWLGRGGIAQTTPAWTDALNRGGHESVVVTRRDRELTGAHVKSPAEGSHALVTHRRVAQLAARVIAECDPAIIVVQNYVVPGLEAALDRALRTSRARSVFVVHDHRLHSRAAGMRLGLRTRLRAVDVVVTHSQYVADAVADYSGRADIVVIPLPVPTAAPGGTSRLEAGPGSAAIGFGVMRRSYKGMDLIGALGARGVPGRRFAVAGTGAPVGLPGIQAIPGYLPTPDLAATVGDASAALFPYSFATQSAGVLFAQRLGVVPIATAVGGIPEQIVSGVDGVLVPPGAGLDVWQAALGTVHEDHDRLAAGARARADAVDADFREHVGALL
ncbi:MAG: glycosyltransferase [Acidimicrobiia bacterium]